MWKEVGPNIDWEQRMTDRQSHLPSQAALWPTPTAVTSSRRETARKPHWKAKSGATLTDASLLHGTIQKGGIDGTSQVLLNPQFVETLMGLPIGWTDFDPLETPPSLSA